MPQHAPGRISPPIEGTAWPGPDFIIGGAMKSGTTSLHHLLAALPGVFMPDVEIFFFDIDDVEQHPDFFVGPDGEWHVPSFDRNAEKYRRWYASFFEAAGPDTLVGEDSTTYLASRHAPDRIRRLLPNARLIFMLRNPADRTYSHYWHLVRTGRATRGFEETLRWSPGTLFQRSRYREQAQRYLDVFPRDQLLFVLFEDFVADPLGILRRAAAFLGLPEPDALPAAPHRNPARVPRSVRLQLLANRLFRPAAELRFHGHLPETSRASGGVGAVGSRLARINLHSARPPAMAPGTRAGLNEIFALENAGLGEMLDLDVDAHWYRDA